MTGSSDSSVSYGASANVSIAARVTAFTRASQRLLRSAILGDVVGWDTVINPQRVIPFL